MRRVRTDAGVSLRTLERRGTWRRSTISQVETAKAHPSRELVAWYDEDFGADGLLLSMYAEARSRHLLGRGSASVPGAPPRDSDRVRVVSVEPAHETSVERDVPVHCRLVLANDGSEPWRDRLLRRMGAYSGGRLLSGAEHTAVPVTAVGATAELELELRTPDRSGAVVAFWSLVDADGHERAVTSPPVSVLLVVR